MELFSWMNRTFTSVDQYNPEYGNGIGYGKRVNTAPDQDVTYWRSSAFASGISPVTRRSSD